MNKTPLVSILVAACSVAALNAATNANLVAHWTFDEGAGFIAHDVTGIHDGQLSTNGLVFVTNGISGNALHFDRSEGGYVQVPHLAELVTNDFSLVAWARQPVGDTTPETALLTQHEAYQQNGVLLYLGAGGGSKASFFQNGAAEITSTTSVNDGAWHQVVAVYELNGQTRLYVDGSPLEASIASQPLTNLGAPFVIGGVYGVDTPGVSSGRFTGWIDEVQVYRGALTDTQIDRLYSAPGLNLDDLEVPPTITPDGGPFVESVTVTLQVATTGGAILFTLDGTDPTPVSAQYSNPLVLTNTVTLKAQLFVGGAPASDIASATFTRIPAIAFLPDGGPFTNSIAIVIQNNLAAGTTLVYTLDGSDPTASGATYAAPISLSATTTVRARLFANSLPASEIFSAHFVRMNPFVDARLVAHWRFDEAFGTNAHDSAGLYDAALSSTGAYFESNGVAGNALRLDRTQSGYARASSVQEVATNDFCLLGWLKVPAGDTTQLSFFFSQHQAGVTNGMFAQVGVASGLGAVGKIGFMMNDGGHFIRSTDSVNDGDWHHVALSYRRGELTRLYVDGLPAEASMPSLDMVHRNAPFVLGGVHGHGPGGSTGGLFTGWIDDVQIYTGPVTEAQIEALRLAPGKNLDQLYEPLSLSPSGTNFVNSIQVTLTSGIPGVEIRYTLDGNEPVESSPGYAGPITLTTTTTIKARLFVGSIPASDVVSGTFTLLPAVGFAPEGGLFTNSVQVTVLNHLGVGTAAFTTNGSDPVATNDLYSSPLTFSAATTLKVRLFLNGFPISEVFTASFARVYALDDGIDNAWRELHFGSGYLTDPRVAATADPDGDGWNNLLEFQGGTIPTDPTSHPTINLAIRAIPLLSWNSIPGQSYRVLRKSTITATNWEVVLPSFQATDTNSSHIDVDAPSTAIYQIELVP